MSLKEYDNYYASIDMQATNDVLKGQLQSLTYPHGNIFFVWSVVYNFLVVFVYDDVWNAFESVDKFLPTYPCSANSSNVIIYYIYFFSFKYFLDSGCVFNLLLDDRESDSRRRMW